MAGISGQTLNDRLNAARYALAGQGLARVVCKATTEEMIAPKKKHIDYLLQCTNEPNVSIPQLANLLIERTTHSSWIVVFKSLVTVHHLMCYGNERFTQYLASSNSNFQLNNYTDKNAPRGYEMSTFIRRYARYLNAKALSYRTVAFDFTKVKRGSGDGQLRSMNIEKLLKTVPTLQNQIDALLEFDCNAGELNNGVINAAFFLLFKDLIRLFACYNDGIINCLEKYFEMSNKKQARETLETYKKFLIRMNKVAEFLKVAENVGIDKGEIPDLTKAPSSLLDAMEQHLAAMEGKKITPTSSTVGTNGEQKDENSLKKAIEEEEQFLNRLKEKHLQEKKVVSNPFMDLAPASGAGASESKPAGSSGILDLFTTDDTENANNNNNTNASSTVPSAAALAAATSNPFADILSAMTITPGAATAGATGTAAPPPGADAFATSDNFAAAFGTSSNSNVGFDAFGDVLQPQNVSSSSAAATGGSTNLSQVPNSVPTNHFANLSSLSVSQHQSSNSATTSSSINHNSLSSPSLSSSAATGVGIAANATNNNSSNNNKNVPSSSSSQSLVKGDLDASLASLAQNLDINGPKGGGFINKKGPFNLSPQSTKKSGAPLNASGSSLLGGGGGGSTNSSSGLGMMWNPNHMPSMSMMSQAQQNPMISSAGWSPNPGLGSTSIGGGGGVGGLWATGSAAGSMQPQMMMMGGVGTGGGGGGMATAIHGQQQPLIMPNTSTMTLPFGIRPAASMMPGAISVLPSGVTPAALSNALSSASVLSGNNSRTNQQQQQQQQAAAADPFGAL